MNKDYNAFIDYKNKHRHDLGTPFEWDDNGCADHG
jgi:hypothetical protein